MVIVNPEYVVLSRVQMSLLPILHELNELMFASRCVRKMYPDSDEFDCIKNHDVVLVGIGKLIKSWIPLEEGCVCKKDNRDIWINYSSYRVQGVWVRNIWQKPIMCASQNDIGLELGSVVPIEHVRWFNVLAIGNKRLGLL